MLLTEIDNDELRQEIMTLQGRCRANHQGWLCERCQYDCHVRAKPYKAPKQKLVNLFEFRKDK